MPPTTVENTEQFRLDGPFGLPIAVLVVVLLMAVFTWLLYRERKILGQRFTVLFWVLRGVALATVMWMLLAPTNVLVQVTTTRQSVAIVTDISDSMRTIDPAGTADEIRWVAAQTDDDNFVATSAADRAVAAAGIAEHHLQIASNALKQHQRESLVVEATSAAQDAINRTRENVEAVARRGGGSVSQNGSSRRSPLATRILRSLDGPEFHEFSDLAAKLKKGRTPSQKGWRESLPDLEHRIAGIRRQLRELSADMVEHESQLAQGKTKVLATLRSKPRLARTADFLETLNAEVLTAIKDTADVRMCSFDNSMTRLANQNQPAEEINALIPRPNEVDESAVSNSWTDISAVLEQLNRERVEQPLAAAFLFTDVSHNQRGVANPRDVAAELQGTPIYVVPIGNTEHVRDVMIQSVFVPNVAMRNDDIVIEATIQAYDCAGESCVVRLLQDGEEIDSRLVEIDSGFASRPVRFERKMAEIGTQQFQISVEPLEDELTDRNNVDDFEVNVTRAETKLLLADELPRWEYRYLAQLFRRDPNVECDELLFQPRLIATGRRKESGTFPTTVDEWDQYDVVILGDLPPSHLSDASQASLTEYLKERGGTVFLIAGTEMMPHAFVDHPLEDILPVSPVPDAQRMSDENGYAFHVTEEGLQQDALMIGENEESTRIAWNFINQVSPIYQLSPWRQPRAAAHTLISAIPRGTLDVEFAARQNALLCWQPIGRGMAVYLSAPDTWRLRLLRGDRLHYKFWGQLLRWAIASDLSAGSEAIRIKSDKSRYSTDETIQVAVRLTDPDGNPVVADDVQAVARSTEEKTIPLVSDPEIPGQYVGEARGLPPGEYSLEVVGETVEQLLQQSEQEATPASFSVQADLPVELLDTRCDRALAQQIADITGGQVIPPTAVEEVLNLTNLEPEVTERMEAKPLWLEWKYLWLVFGCLQTEWIIRKWKGLS